MADPGLTLYHVATVPSTRLDLRIIQCIPRHSPGSFAVQVSIFFLTKNYLSMVSFYRQILFNFCRKLISGTLLNEYSSVQQNDVLLQGFPVNNLPDLILSNQLNREVAGKASSEHRSQGPMQMVLHTCMQLHVLQVHMSHRRIVTTVQAIHRHAPIKQGSHTTRASAKTHPKLAAPTVVMQPSPQEAACGHLRVAHTGIPQ